ncbi:MAG: hypothetical protein K9J30_05405 [Bacteroidales bacterium]|nr:hypothetical protein [Bacteroidales bacterium]
MGIPRFFKLTEPNRFNYQPLYWDPDKEDREERVRRIKAELGQEVEFNKKSSAITRGSFRQYSGKTRRKAGRESNLRLFVIAAVLMLLAYLLFYR